jgi:hypothetical protein
MLNAGKSECSPTRDHVRPKWDGGTLKVNCCRKCNSDKGGLFLTEWLEILRANGDPRVVYVENVAAAHPVAARPSGRRRPSGEWVDDGRRTDAELILEELRGVSYGAPFMLE